MKIKSNLRPPRWADHFLEWYCNPALLEEIQGDAHELFYRKAKESQYTAKWLFVWNVIRFFRWRNIKGKRIQNINYSIGMLQNILKVAFRNFFRHPGHSLLNLAGLSISFTAALIIGLWVFHEFSFDRFHDESDKIFQVISHAENNGSMETYMYARPDINTQSIPEIDSKTVVISGKRWPNELCFRPDGKPNECVYLFGIYSDKSFFDVFSFPIVAGDRNPLQNPTNIAISESMALKLYGKEDPIGKTIKIDDHFPVTIASIFKDIPSNSTLQFEFVIPKEVFSRMRGLDEKTFNNTFFPLYLKTNKYISAEALTEKLNGPGVLTEDLVKDKIKFGAFPYENSRLHGDFINGVNVGGRIQYVNLFLLVAFIVVIMAIINFVNLSTAKASTRAKEIGIRKVTGAKRTSIIIQFISESFLIVTLAFAIALISTQLVLPFLNRLLGEALSVSLLSSTMIKWIIIFLAAVALAAGLYPALIMSSFQPAIVLKGVTTTKSSGAQFLRKALLVLQVSASIGIVIFTGVLFQQLSFIQKKNLGMDKENIIHIEPTYRLLQHYDGLKDKLLAYPSIKSVTLTAADPVNLDWQTDEVSWPGKPDGTKVIFKILGGSYEVPETFGLTLLEGRFAADKPQDSLNTEVVLSESAVRLMGLENPIGEKIRMEGQECIVIGVMKDFHTASLRQMQTPLVFYVHPTLNCSRVYIKYQEGTLAESLAIIQAAYKEQEPSFSMKYDFLDEAFDKMYKTEKTASIMLVFFTSISLLIAVIGVAGLATYNIVRRKKEIGVRRVFGASIIELLSMLSREFIVLIVIAASLAVPLTWYGANQWLSGFAYRIDIPWLFFELTIAGMMALTVLIILIQGLETVRTNPTETLRNE